MKTDQVFFIELLLSCISFYMTIKPCKTLSDAKQRTNSMNTSKNPLLGQEHLAVTFSIAYSKAA